LYKKRLALSIEPIWWEYYRPGHPLYALRNMWWNSLSSFFVLALFHCWFVITRHQIRFYFPSMCVFWISHFVRYQIGAMNNSKVFFTGWFVIAVIMVAEVILKLWKSILRLIAIVLVMEMTAASVCCFIHTLSRPNMILSDYSIEYANWIIENVPHDAIAITDSHGYSPFCFLAGRMSFLSFIGWPASQGIDIGDRVNLSNKFQKTKYKSSLLSHLGMSYADMLREDPLNLSANDLNWNIVFENYWFTLREFLPPRF
jgi:hypothetical protein